MTDTATKGARTGDVTIRSFQIDFAQEAVDDMRRRIAATRWPDPETVTDDSQGVPLALMQAGALTGEQEYDWRRCEAKLQALPHFLTEIDGLTSTSSCSLTARGRVTPHRHARMAGSRSSNS
jgi:hypothetical protein